MSFIKISDLTEKVTLAGTEEVLINDSGTSKKMATQRFLDVQTAAEAAETNAAASATSASNAATAAAGYSATATAQAALAAASASDSSTSASAASSSASSAASAQSAAATSESNAAASESAAATSESNAAASESAAATSESNAATSESNAATSATNASNSASAAATSATNASNSASAAATSATNASNSASAASTSASNASSSATAASNAQSAAETARDQTLSAFDSFDDRYLGTKASDPSVDNDGNALVAGALYFNSTDGEMKVYDGSQWLAAYASLSGALLATNNLSDLNNASTARTNLGLGTAATTASTDYATAAQGSTADSALQNLVEDTTPQLGGTLDANGNSIDMGTYTITDASVGQWDSTSLTVGTKESNWDAAYGWGNHASAGYLTGITGQSIENLSDVATMTPSDGQLLTWDSGTSKWNAEDAPVSLPDQTGNSGKYLTSNGTTASWDALATVANTGAYSDLSGTPTNVSTFTNDSGYITGNQTITLSGDATGSGTTSIAVTVANDSHTHDTRYYTETEIGNFFSGSTAITGYSKSNWDTAYGWGNHASAGYLTGNQTITLSGDATGSGTTAITVTVANDSHSHSTSTLTGLGALATLSSVNASTITDNSVGAAELNVSGNGTTSQYLRSDGDGTFTWATPPDTNTTYSAGSGLSLAGTTFSHSDTSSVSSVNNSGNTFIQDLTFDTYGHVTAVTSAAVSGVATYDSASSSTGYFDLPSGTTAQRPGSPNTGMVRYNTDLEQFEGFNGYYWAALSDAIAFEVEYLVIAGGGSGGHDCSGGNFNGSGGGAGGYRSSVSGESSGGGASAESPFSFSLNTNYTVTIGAGATADTGYGADNGSDSVFASITSIGGGGGGGVRLDCQLGYNGGNGGSGGGNSNTTSTGLGTEGQGYRGANNSYNSGGGGAGAIGSGSTGGTGVSSSITGTAVTRAGGGAGGSGTAGAGGGGAPATSGTANTGGGGGGRDAGVAGGNGGSGVVILKYLDFLTITNPGGGLTFSTSSSGGYKVTTFTAGTGNIQFTA